MAASIVRRRGTDSSGRGIYATDYMWSWWLGVCKELGFTPVVTQSAWMLKNGGGAADSAGYHDGGGTFDLRVWNLTDAEVAKTVRVLRRRGAAAWLRNVQHGGFTDPHIHFVLGSDFGLSGGAKQQWAAYIAGRDGLASNGRDYHWRPDPLVLKPPKAAPVTAYHWHQPGELGSAESGSVLGVRKSFGNLTRPSTIVGSRGTREGGGIRARSILRARVTTIAPRKPLSFPVAAGHAPPPRAPIARGAFMHTFAKVPARFKGGDMNVGQQVASRLLDRRVEGDGVLWLTVPRLGWKVLSTQAVDVGGDHKAILTRVRNTRTGVVVRVLVINAMSVSAGASKAADIFAAGLALKPHIVMGSECSDFRALTVDANHHQENR